MKFDEIYITKFDGSGYIGWAKSVQSALREASCISAINPGKVSEDVEGRAYRIIHNSVDKTVAAMLKLDGTANEIWNQIRTRYGTLQPRDELKMKAKIQEFKVSNADNLKEYVVKKCLLINEYIDRGGNLDDGTRCAYLLDGLDGKWELLGLQMSDWRFDDAISELLNRAEREPAAPAIVLRTQATRSQAGPPPFPCNWCQSREHWHFQCPKRLCSKCGKLGHYGQYCDQNKFKIGKYSRSRKWIVDSGATVHVTNDPSELKGWRKCDDKRITGFKGESAEVVAIGSVILDQGLKLNNVHCVPETSEKIISVAQLEDDGFDISIKNGAGSLTRGKERYQIRRNPYESLYTLTDDQPAEQVMLSVGKSVKPSERTAEQWHKSLCHLNNTDVKTLEGNQLVEGLKIRAGTPKESCNECLKGKMTRAVQDKTAYRIASHPGEIISCDLVDLRNLPGSNGEKYVSVLIDHYTGYTSAKAIMEKNASEVLSHIKEFVAFVEQQTERSVKIIRSDNGLEYSNDQSLRFFKEKGIEKEFTSAYNPAGNGMVERRNRTLMEGIRTALNGHIQDIKMWPYALKHVVYVQNRTLVSAISKTTPYEGIFGIPPDVSEIREFGRRCWVFIEHPDNKLSRKVNKCLLLGNEESKDGFLVLDIQRNTISRSRNVHFEEPNQNEIRKSPRFLYQNDEVVMSARVDGDTPSLKCALSGARKDDWMKSIKAEYENLTTHGAWEPIDKVNLDRFINSMIILKVKRNADGCEARLKSRLVALGNHQQQDIDFRETYAPTLKEKTLMIMLALSNYLQYEVDHIDVDGAYLNADLKEDIVMRIPYPMAEWAGSEFVRLRKAIYGLRQSGYEWNQCLTQHLIHKGYKQSEGDNCLFIGNAEGKPAFIMVYVDDLVLMAPCHKSMQKMKHDISERFSVKDLGELSHILGIRVHRNRSENSFTLDQTTAVETLLINFKNLIERKTPLHVDTARKLQKNAGEVDQADVRRYQSIIGSLMYFSRWTRPDIAAAVSLLSRYAKNPGKEHFEQLMHLLGYLKKHPSLGVTMKRNNQITQLKMYADADWAEDPDDRKSTTGFVICVDGNPVIWKSIKQTCISKSTMQAEYVAMGSCFTEGEWTANLLAEVGYKCDRIELYCDNQAAIRVVTRGEASGFTKHIGVKLHTLHEAISRNELELSYVKSECNLADIFTKPLENIKHKHCLELLSMKHLDRGSVNFDIQVSSDTLCTI